MKLLTMYKKLLKAFGPQNWWPIRKRKFDEVVIGAVLTQNTSWRNVEKALDNFDEISLKRIRNLPLKDLEKIIRPSGFYKQKARRLKSVSEITKKISREELLNINGIGPETADTILLYALDKPEFVIDAYTKRILNRIYGIEFKHYDEWKEYITSRIPRDVEIYKEFHALLVELAKRYCKKKPLCDKCPLRSECKYFKKLASN